MLTRGSLNRVGVALCLCAAVGFGALSIFGKLAYDAGAAPLTLLLLRFVLATSVFAALLLARPSLAASPRSADRRSLAIGFALGAFGYAAQAGLFFAALQRLDPSLLALLLYTYPAWVVLGAFVLGRERPTARRLFALAVATVGLVALLAGASHGEFDALGVTLALATAVVYAGYILASDAVTLNIAPPALTALVCLGATCSFAIAGAISGAVQHQISTEALLWIAAIAVVSTVLPIMAFFGGLARVGPGSAAILLSLDPVVTVILAWIVFGEVLSGRQLAGALLVVGAAAVIASTGRIASVPPD